MRALCDPGRGGSGILGPDTKIGYAADWSEYFGHQPGDGSGDVLYHLDPLWASPAIDFIGIDNYMPLSDWRDGAGPCRRGGGVDLRPRYLTGNVAGGEGYDWYYADAAGRAAQDRIPIRDGAYGEDWVFRYKDLVSWWSTPHFNRLGGVKVAGADGLAAAVEADLVHRARLPGGGQGDEPAERLPRSEVVGELLSVLLDRWPGRFHPASLPPGDFRPLERAGEQPASAVYGGRMVDMERAHVWAWDARPWPDFPNRLETWVDGGNYETGHWLNGRASIASLAEVVAEVCVALRAR